MRSRLALALALERLQAAFYAEAVAGGALDGEALDFATTAADQEAEHVALLTPLVPDAPEEPAYDFGQDTSDPAAFATAAASLEDLAVAAYNGLLPGLSEQGLATAAASSRWTRATRPGSAPSTATTPRPRPRTPASRRRGRGPDRGHGLPDGGGAVSGLRLDDLDRDGALREAASRLPESTRRAFLARRGRRRGPPARGLADARRGRAQADSDVSILNYALTLEYLQADFYTEAERQGALSARRGARGRPDRVGRAGTRPGPAQGARGSGRRPPDLRLQGHHRRRRRVPAHGRRLRGPRHGAYKGQLGEIRAPAYVAAAVSIHTVEARHAAWIRYLAGAHRPPRPSTSRSPRRGRADRRLDRVHRRRGGDHGRRDPRSRGEAGGSRRMLRRAALLVAACWCALAAGCLGVLVAAVASISSSPEPSLLPPTGDIAEPPEPAFAVPARAAWTCRRRPPAGPP